MKEKLIILGAGVMQGPVISIAKELGFFAIALDVDPAAPSVGMADQFEQIDLKDKEEIEAFAAKTQREGGLCGIMTAGTDFSASVAWVSERLGLPGIPYQAALNASDKSIMRGCFEAAGLPSPRYAEINAADKSIPFADADFPLVIKPVDNMGSRGCRRLDNMDEFEAAAAAALGFSRSGRAIVEDFMEGPEFSVDAIVYRGDITICGLADRHIFFPPYFIEMGHTMPTTAELPQREAILQTFCAGIRSLGLAGKDSVGAAKGDIKLTPKGPMIGEIAARLSGGYMSGWTYPYSSGVRPIQSAILIAAGRKPEDFAPRKEWTCAERAFISIPGTVKALVGHASLNERPLVKDVFLRVGAGNKVTFPENNVTKCGNVLAAASTRKEAVKAAEDAVRSVLIRLECGDPDTDSFLAARKSAFPPDAFRLSAALEDELAKIPPTKVAAGGEPCLAPFPALAESGLKDYAGRSVEESLQAVRILTGFSLGKTHESADNITVLGRTFWEALVRGSYQGAVYYIDCLGLPEGAKGAKGAGAKGESGASGAKVASESKGAKG
ncbi:MAG: ATP-grasp domain-containing protein [Spirochaetes bacterium]|nr:ATP-grasp domain-containing protein [Spirochaetota bacterium]